MQSSGWKLKGELNVSTQPIVASTVLLEETIRSCIFMGFSTPHVSQVDFCQPVTMRESGELNISKPYDLAAHSVWDAGILGGKPSQVLDFT